MFGTLAWINVQGFHWGVKREENRMYTDDISQDSFKTKVINLHGSGDFTDSVEVSFDSDSCRA